MSPEAGAEDFETLEFDVFWNADRCGVHSDVLNAREVRIIDDAEDLDATLELATTEQVSPEVDFESDVVALVVLGNWDCSDYVPVTAVREFEDRVEVEWTHQTRCFDDDGICSPCSFTVVPRRDKPYEFRKRVEYASTCPDGYIVPDE